MAGAWKAGGRAEGPPQESRELPAKKAEALLTLMSRPLHLLCPNPNLDLDLEREASGFGAEAEVPGAAVWSLSLGEWQPSIFLCRITNYLLSVISFFKRFHRLPRRLLCNRLFMIFAF